MVRKLCVLAGVPLTCTHSLRGLYATLAVQSGSASHVGASSLGHGSFEITQQHYAQASSVAYASTARCRAVWMHHCRAKNKPSRWPQIYPRTWNDRFCYESRSCWRNRTRALNQRNYTPQSIRSRSVTLKWRMVSDEIYGFIHQAVYCPDPDRLTLKRSAAMRDASASRRW